MTAKSMTATAASASSTTTKPIGALIKYNQIPKAVQMTKPKTASHSRKVRALVAGAAPPIPAVGSCWSAVIPRCCPEPFVLLIIHHIVLAHGDHVVSLDGLGHRDPHHPGEVGVLGEVFEVAASDRGPMQTNAGPLQDVLA